MTHEKPKLPDPQSPAGLRDQVIFEATGIMPDPRGSIPAGEITALVAGAQARDPEAAQRLVATRLRWIYGKYVESEEVGERYDLEPADVLWMGSLATLEAARGIDTDEPDVPGLLHSRTPDIMGRLMTESKLLPAISDAGHKLTHARYKRQADLMTEAIVPVGDKSDVDQLAGLMEADPEEVAMEHALPDVIGEAMEVLGFTERYVIAARFSVDVFSGHEPMTLSEVGRDLGLNREKVRRIQVKALKKLGFAYARLTGQPALT